MCKFIECISSDKVELEVYECECGFHMGFDSSYLEQVDSVQTICPSCDKVFDIKDGLDGV